MKRKVMALVLPMMCGLAACSLTPKIENAGSDPAVLASCPRSVTPPGDLPGGVPFQLDDGRWVMPLEQAVKRENMLTAGALVLRAAWIQCRSVVVYVADREAELAQ